MDRKVLRATRTSCPLCQDRGGRRRRGMRLTKQPLRPNLAAAEHAEKAGAAEVRRAAGNEAMQAGVHELDLAIAQAAPSGQARPPRLLHGARARHAVQSVRRPAAAGDPPVDHGHCAVGLGDRVLEVLVVSELRAGGLQVVHVVGILQAVADRLGLQHWDLDQETLAGNLLQLLHGVQMPLSQAKTPHTFNLPTKSAWPAPRGQSGLWSRLPKGLEEHRSPGDGSDLAIALSQNSFHTTACAREFA
eukprot:CAMPEP_0179018168 /NCGR_PEP_ID=MMETSP0796-20121207/4214_1 /TAXON_ID=73915 /ORGANISM="Pyrodinium bahamense, Strain pbaha01" /LENGTH=245 /DNA_ID=CAMNT_0020713917 /DNA_START=363 /DNA_END=1102 /DNA_ORIENTATION=+